RKRDGQRVLLAHVAEIEPRIPNVAVPVARLQQGEELVQLLARSFQPVVGEPDDPRRRALARHVGPEQPPGGEVPRVARNDDAIDVELVGEQRRKEWTGSAEGDEYRLARVAALLDGDLADRVGHACGGDRDHTAGGLLCRAQPELLERT